MASWTPPHPRILDRYIVREIIPPTSLGLLVFTFILLIDQIPRLLAVLVSRSADFPTIVRVFLNLLPSILAVTIPMAFLLGVLLAFGRMASDSEIIAFRAVGVSPLRLLGPVFALSIGAALVTFYIMAVALPAANQAHRELIFSLIVTRARTVVKPRTFTADLLPGRMMLYVSDVASDTGLWKNVFIHDTRDPSEPALILAREGRLVIDQERHTVRVELGEGARHTFPTADPQNYRLGHFKSLGFDLPFEELFPKPPLSKGDREMTLEELTGEIQKRQEQKRPKVEWARFEVEWHKKFAIPFACIVFGFLGLGLSLGSKKEARSAAFALSIGVIFVYYILIRLGEQAGDTGLAPPFLAMWGANIVLGTAALGLLVLNLRSAAFDPLDPAHYLAFLPRVRRTSAPGAGATPPPRRPVVVVRLPRIPLRFPSILDRYIARTGASLFGLILLGFTSIFFLAEFMDLFDDIQQNRVRGWVVVHYYAYHVLAIAHLMAPVAILVAVLVALGVLARRNEFTAMKAGGISVYRAMVPVIGLGILASGLLYAMQEFVLPYTNKIAALDFNVIKGRPPQSSDRFDRRWMLSGDSRLYNYDYVVERKSRVPAALAEPGARDEFSLYGLSVYDVDPKDWELRERLYAARASWHAASRSYDLERGWRRATGQRSLFRSFDHERVRALGREPGGELEPPSYFKREERPSDTMSFAELAAHIASLEARGFDVASLRVQLHRKLAFPVVGLVMTLLGIPFSFVVARRGALYGIGASIVIGIFYWAALGIFEALGNNALLPSFLAAWAPNLLFAAAGLYLLFTIDT